MRYAALIVTASFTLWTRGLHRETIYLVQDFAGAIFHGISYATVNFQRRLQMIQPSHNGQRNRTHSPSPQSRNDDSLIFRSWEETPVPSFSLIASVLPKSSEPSDALSISGQPLPPNLNYKPLALTPSSSASINSVRNTSTTINLHFISPSPSHAPTYASNSYNDDKNVIIPKKTTNKTDKSASTNVTWSGCVDPNTGYEAVAKNKRTYICITVGKLGDWSNEINSARWTFKPTADEYSHFRIKNSYRDLVLNEYEPFGEQVSVHVASHRKLSFIRMYYNKDGGKVYPHLTAILDVDRGEVKGIAWDNACVFCGDERCEENTYDFSGKLADSTVVGEDQVRGCYITREECEEQEKQGNNECDLNIYFVWTGTDKDGSPLHSAGSRWSAFPPAKIPKLDLTKITNLI